MKFKFFATAMAALALASCSNNDDVLDNNQQQVNNGEDNYLAITIKNTKTTGSRAASFDGYEDGYKNNVEGYVSKVRFYLFDAQGKARNINNTFTDDGANTSNTVNFIDYTVSQNGVDPSQKGEDGDDVETGAWAAEGNIESTISAVLVIKEEKDNLPSQIVAIANYDQCKELPTISTTLKQLQDIIGDYDIETASQGAFLMSNSVYSNGSKAIDAATITSANWAASADAAKANPVTIHIERVIAKVEIDWSNWTADDTNNTYKMPVTDPAKIDNTEKTVYAVIKGWGVTRVREKSTLLKDLNATYTNLGITNWWNDSDHFRSYWAETTTDNNNIRHPYAYNNAAEESGLINLVGNMPDSIYVQENTSNVFTSPTGVQDAGDGYTEVVFAAQLQYEDGSEAQLYEYAGQYYTEPADILQSIGSTAKIYVLKDDVTYTEGGVEYTESNYKSISATEMEFTAEAQNNQTRYKSVPVVKTEAANSVFVKLDTTEGSTTNGKLVKLTEEEVETALKAYAINVYRSGMAYYFIDIEQYTEGTGDDAQTFKGVVRNHIYRIKPTSVIGFGTPVEDETLNIITEKKKDENTYIAAEINVLSWHVVNQNVTLE